MRGQRGTDISQDALGRHSALFLFSHQQKKIDKCALFMHISDRLIFKFQLMNKFSLIKDEESLFVNVCVCVCVNTLHAGTLSLD